MGEEPEGVLVVPDGKTLYVTSEVASGKVVKNIPADKRPRRFVLTPDDKESWITNELGISVSVITPPTTRSVNYQIRTEGFST